MQERNIYNFKNFSNHHLVITNDGVKWLAENYFRKNYLYELEEYKLHLQKNEKGENNEQR